MYFENRVFQNETLFITFVRGHYTPDLLIYADVVLELPTHRTQTWALPESKGFFWKEGYFRVDTATFGARNQAECGPSYHGLILARESRRCDLGRSLKFAGEGHCNVAHK